MKTFIVKIDGVSFEVHAYNRFWLVKELNKEGRGADVYKYGAGLGCAICNYPLSCIHTEAVRLAEAE